MQDAALAVSNYIRQGLFRLTAIRQVLRLRFACVPADLSVAVSSFHRYRKMASIAEPQLQNGSASDQHSAATPSASPQDKTKPFEL